MCCLAHKAGCRFTKERFKLLTAHPAVGQVEENPCLRLCGGNVIVIIIIKVLHLQVKYIFSIFYEQTKDFQVIMRV